MRLHVHIKVAIHEIDLILTNKQCLKKKRSSASLLMKKASYLYLKRKKHRSWEQTETL